MKVFSQLVQAQAENRTSDYSQGTAGLFWVRTDTNALKFDDGATIQTVRKVSDTIAESGGGTNQTTYAQGDVLYASAANTLSKLTVGTSGQFLKSTGTIPQWQTVAGAGSLNFTTKTNANTPYTVSTSADDVIVLDGTSGTIIANLPAASGNTGKVYFFVKKDSATNVVGIKPNGADTIAGTTFYNLTVQRQVVEMVSDGTSDWVVLNG